MDSTRTDAGVRRQARFSLSPLLRLAAEASDAVATHIDRAFRLRRDTRALSQMKERDLRDIGLMRSGERIFRRSDWE